MKRLEKSNCRDLIGGADVDAVFSKITISPYDQFGQISDIEGVAAETQLEDEQGNRVLNGQINFSPLNSSPFFFSGISARGLGIRGRNLSQAELRELILIHELVHTGDATGKYDDVVGIVNSNLNGLILKNCF